MTTLVRCSDSIAWLPTDFHELKSDVLISLEINDSVDILHPAFTHISNTRIIW